MEQTREWIEVAERLAETKKLIKYYEGIETELSNRLRILSDNKNSRGAGYIFYQIKRKGSIDYTSIPGIESMDLEKYRKPEQIYWKLDRD